MAGRHVGLRGVLVLFGISIGGAEGGPVRADETPVSVVDWLKARGEDASIDARRALFGRYVGGEGYAGTAEQNVRLLQALTSRGEAAAPGGRSGGAATPQPRTVRQGDVEVTYDVSTLVLSLELALDVRWVGGAVNWRAPAPPETVEETPILPTLPADGAAFVSAAVLSQKAKQFDDGLYAAVELALEGGSDGKRDLLRRIRERLVAAAARDAGAEIVEAAARLGAVPGAGPAGIGAAVEARLAEFEADPLRSKPLGFYPWSEELTRVFRQDRMLQTKMEPTDARSLVEALKSDPVARAGYERVLRCYERLTNPYVAADLRSLLGPASGPVADDPVCFLPSSRAHESDLAKRLYGGAPVPEGANLMNQLVEEVQAGRLSLRPTAGSGWYDRQTWSFEPMLRPDRTPEAPHLTLGPRYRAYLVELFKGLLALTRETHVKQVDMSMCGACAGPQTRPLYLRLPLTVEPLPTHYARRAEAYAFVRSVLEDTFGPATVATLRRETANGPVPDDLAQELTFLERLFRGAAEVSRAEVGAPDTGQGLEAEADRALFHRWVGSMSTDPDLTQDARMMVPVFYDLGRQKTKVWVFLGWTRQTLDAGVATPPRVLSTRRLAEVPTWDGHVRFTVSGGAIYAPVVAEVYVTELLDRKEVRRRCDEGKTRSAILASLR